MSEPNDYSDQIQKLSPAPGDLLVIYPKSMMTREQHQLAVKDLQPLAESLGCRILVSSPGIAVALHPDPAAVLAEMRKQTAILESMAEQQGLLLQELAGNDGVDGDDLEPTTYIDGSPILGGR